MATIQEITANLNKLESLMKETKNAQKTSSVPYSEIYKGCKYGIITDLQINKNTFFPTSLCKEILKFSYKDFCENLKDTDENRKARKAFQNLGKKGGLNESQRKELRSLAYSLLEIKNKEYETKNPDKAIK